MNVRIVPRDQPQRTNLFSGVMPPLVSDGERLLLEVDAYVFGIPLREVAEILLDEDPGGGF